MGLYGNAGEGDGKMPVAPKGTRYVGLCRSCHDFVELGKDFSCRDVGHSSDSVAAAVLIDEREKRPRLPKFHWGAFLMPALWGPGHGQWYMILMYPVWMFLDNLVYAGVHNLGLYTFLAVLCLAAMATFMVFYAREGYTSAYLYKARATAPDEVDFEGFIKRERIWTIAMTVIAVAFIVFATWYNLAIRPTMPGLDASIA